MSEETMLKLRQMLINFGAARMYWQPDELETFAELEAAILELRSMKSDNSEFV